MEDIQMRTMKDLHAGFWLPMQVVLGNMNSRGILLDADATSERAAVAEEIITDAEVILNQWASDYVRQTEEPLNWSSSTQVCKFLHDYKCMPLSPVTGAIDAPKRNPKKRGEPKSRSVSSAALAWLAKNSKSKTSQDMLRLLARRNKVTSLHQFLSKLPGECAPDERIHSSISALAETGRLTSKMPNLQNIPTRGDFLKMRKGFIAKRGCVLVVADYSQLEMYVMAHFLIHLFDSREMYDDILAGDVHTEAAFRIWGDQLEALGATRANIKEVAGHIRGWAKTTNYAVPYGKSAYGLGDQIRDAEEQPIGKKAAQEILDAYFAAYTKLPALFEFWKDQARETGCVYTLLGRTRPLPGINSSSRGERASAERQAQNTPVQGSAADIVTTAMLRTNSTLIPGYPQWYNKKLDNLGSNLVLQVHDELVFEVPEENADEAMAEVVRCMENPFDAPLKVQLRVDAEYAKSWGDCK